MRAAPGATALAWGTLDVAAASPLRRGGLPLRDDRERPPARAGRRGCALSAAANPAHPYATLLRARAPEDEVKEAVAALDGWLAPAGLRVHGSLAQTRWLADVHGAAARGRSRVLRRRARAISTGADEIALVDVPGLAGLRGAQRAAHARRPSSRRSASRRAPAATRATRAARRVARARRRSRRASRGALDDDAARSGAARRRRARSAPSAACCSSRRCSVSTAPRGTRAWLASRERRARRGAGRLAAALARRLPARPRARRARSRARGVALRRGARRPRIEARGRARARASRLRRRRDARVRRARARDRPLRRRRRRRARRRAASSRCSACRSTISRGRRVDGLAPHRLVRRDYEGEQPLFAAGVRTDTRLRPLGEDGLPRFANLLRGRRPARRLRSRARSHRPRRRAALRAPRRRGGGVVLKGYRGFAARVLAHRDAARALAPGADGRRARAAPDAAAATRRRSDRALLRRATRPTASACPTRRRAALAAARRGLSRVRTLLGRVRARRRRAAARPARRRDRGVAPRDRLDATGLTPFAPEPDAPSRGAGAVARLRGCRACDRVCPVAIPIHRVQEWLAERARRDERPADGWRRGGESCKSAATMTTPGARRRRGGQPISLDAQRQARASPTSPILPFIEGDGTGPDIWAASVRVFDAAVAKAYGGKRKIAWMEVLAGQKAFDADRRVAPRGDARRVPHLSASASRVRSRRRSAAASAASTSRCARSSTSTCACARCAGTTACRRR